MDYITGSPVVKEAKDRVGRAFNLSGFVAHNLEQINLIPTLYSKVIA
jgi:hypothetical protein